VQSQIMCPWVIRTNPGFILALNKRKIDGRESGKFREAVDDLRLGIAGLS